jgi:anti-sigma regulatory factor (Ser/Thr protein kinase)
VVDRRDAGPVAQAEPGGPRSSEWRFPSTAASVPAVRRALRPFLADAPLPGRDVDDLVLAACEAATNAIEHAQRSTELFFDVRAEIDGASISIVIRDYGRWDVAMPRPGDRGRGLRMMTMLAAVSLISGPLGTSVTLRNLQY